MQRVSAMVMRQTEREREVEGRHHNTRQHDTIIALHGADKSGCSCLERSQVLLLGDCDTLLKVDNAVPRWAILGLEAHQTLGEQGYNQPSLGPNALSGCNSFCS